MNGIQIINTTVVASISKQICRMEAKKKIVKKIVMSRRFLTISKLIEETKLCSVGLFDLQKKRMQLLKQLHVLQDVKISLSSEILSLKNKHTQSFWETDCQLLNESQFKNNFRMSRRAFYKLCELLPKLHESDSKLSSEKMVAIALYVLGSSDDYSEIANTFGVEKATINKILLRFCDEVWKVLAPIYLNSFPLKKEAVKVLVQEFEALGFPQCMGALDSCHIEVGQFNRDAPEYYNCKGYYSIVLLALVDARSRFIYVSCGSPGRQNDSQIFQTSSLKQYLDECSILDDLKKYISDVHVPVFIIGHSAFQLSNTLMTPYSSRQHMRFNFALSKSHKVAENAFRNLKGRFKRICKVDMINCIQNANAIILSCCALHNFLNANNDSINTNWLEDSNNMEANRLYPKYNSSQTYQNCFAERIRNAISNYLSVEDATADDLSVGISVESESAGVGDVCGEETVTDGVSNAEDEVIGEVKVACNGWYIIDEFISSEK